MDNDFQQLQDKYVNILHNKSGYCPDGHIYARSRIVKINFPYALNFDYI